MVSLAMIRAIKPILFLAVLAGAALPAKADENMLFAPTSAWLVGSASILPQEPGDTLKFPCVMINQFDNGFLVRLSGGDEKIMAMAIDFRQAAFTPDNSYAVKITIPPAEPINIDASAHNTGTLIMNMSSHENFYQTLAAAKTMIVGIDGQELEFAMLGVPEGLKRMEACYAPAEIEKAEAEDNFPVMAQPVIPVPAEALPVAGSQAEEEPEEEETAEEEAPARKTAYRLAQSWASPFNEEPKPAAKSAGLREWSAKENETSLRQVLDGWTKKNDVDLLWLASGDFPAPALPETTAPFEEAVNTLLESYDSAQNRPMGRLYVQPDTGRKVLVIENGKAP